jgi:hypothetical protein
MSPTQITPEVAKADATVGLVTRPRVVVAADANDVMREQLDFLIEHAQGGDCGCPQCNRYHRIRSLLLEAFAELPRRAVALMR